MIRRLALAMLLVAALATPLAADVTGKATSKGPNGLFFMTRFWPMNGMLEKAVWYFAPDGGVYQNLQDGFSKDDLAAHKGRKGTWKLSGDSLEVAWSDGKTTKSKYQPDKSGFGWDAGIFVGVKPFANAKAIAGRYEGGQSLGSGGDRAIVSKTLVLNADGTFTWEGVSFVKSTTSQSTVGAGSQKGTTGTWKASGYSLTLTSQDGAPLRRIAFPYDDETTPVAPDYMYFGGTMYKRR